MKTILLILAFFLFVNTIQAQPYLDLFSMEYINSPDAGIINRDKHANLMSHYSVNFNLPFILNKSKSKVLLFNPFFEKWDFNIPGVPADPSLLNYNPTVQLLSTAFPFVFNTPLNKKWKIATSIIFRTNIAKFDNDYSFDLNAKQIGGFALFIYQKDPHLSFKFGLYYNQEFFGNFFIPLAGIDLKINSKTNLFGVLPAKLTYEHKLNSSFYFGFIFETITNSYLYAQYSITPYPNLNAGHNWYRIDDNRLSVYGDIYPIKKLAIRLEAGHSIARKLRTDKSDLMINDNLYFKIQANYRIRF